MLKLILRFDVFALPLGQPPLVMVQPHLPNRLLWPLFSHPRQVLPSHIVKPFCFPEEVKGQHPGNKIGRLAPAVPANSSAVTHIFLLQIQIAKLWLWVCE
jgi:hypothetical protein